MAVFVDFDYVFLQSIGSVFVVAFDDAWVREAASEEEEEVDEAYACGDHWKERRNGGGVAY